MTLKKSINHEQAGTGIFAVRPFGKGYVVEYYYGSLG